MARTINQLKSPRLGVAGSTPEIIEELRGLFPTVFYEEDIYKLVRLIPPQELDLVIAGPAAIGHGGYDNPWRQVMDEVSVMAFGSLNPPILPVRSLPWRWEIGSRSAGFEAVIPNTTPSSLKRLRDKLVNSMGPYGAKNQPLIRAYPLDSKSYDTEDQIMDMITKGSLVKAKTDDLPIAIQYTHGEPLRGFSWLPTSEEISVEWVVALVLEWGAQKVPGLNEWSAGVPYDLRSQEEVEIERKLQAAHERREKMLEELDLEIALLDSEYNQAKLAAENGVRRILTTQGDVLVSAVASVFQDLGFIVEDVDAGRPDGQAKTEDLRLRVEDDQDWIALVEVKGEKQGTKAKHLTTVERYAAVYAANHHRLPSQLIFVTNYNYQEPLIGRPRWPLEGGEELIAAFSGLVVGTMDLFRLHRDRNQIGLPGARCLLMEPQGTRLSYPPEE